MISSFFVASVIVPLVLLVGLFCIFATFAIITFFTPLMSRWNDFCEEFWSKKIDGGEADE